MSVGSGDRVPTFDTPEPISVTIGIGSGGVHIVAGDRSTTTVRVRPGDESKKSEVAAAQQTRVEHVNGNLLIKAPSQRGLSSWVGKGNAVEVEIELPTGSRVDGDATWAEFACEGTLGDCRFQNVSGDIRLDRTGTLYVETASGNVSVTGATGHVGVNTASGGARIAEVDGTAAIKNGSGDIWVGEATGDLQLNSANGSISVDRPQAGVEAKTAHGSIRIGSVTRGSYELTTASGQIDISVHEGTAVWLDAKSRTGRVRNSLASHTTPEKFSETARIIARNWFGDIVVHRS